MSLRLLFAITFACLVAAAAFGQGLATSTVTAGGSVTASGSISGSFTTPGPPFAMPAVTGAAYSGEEVNEREQTLADGTHITQTMPGGAFSAIPRGAHARSDTWTRRERPMAPTLIEITDPVAGFQYTLDVQGKVAHRFALPPPDQRQTGVRMYNAGGEGSAHGHRGLMVPCHRHRHRLPPAVPA